MALTAGTPIGPYEIVAPLGAGGMGEVYLARDPRLDRTLAIKVLPDATVGDETARRRLLREARLAGQLNHPNICTVYDVGEAGGLTYIAMERVEGRPLDQRIGERGLPPATVARWGAQIADALDYAHRQGVIHRDLKCANVLVTADERIKVLDFGLARRVAAEADDTTVTLTESGVIAGTLQYLAPEILRGGDADVSSDLWSLGVVLYEMACGARPFRGTAAELGAAILNEPPEPLPARVPEALAAVVERCLAKDPAQRYRQAADVRDTLAGWDNAARSEASSLPTSALGPAPRAGRARRWLGAAAVVLAIGIAAVALRARLSPPGAAPPMTSLAVLPLDNFSGDPRQQYFADGMTDELITALAQIGTLRVTSRTSVMGFRGTTRPLPEIARTLGVDAIVEGSVQRSGDRVRVTAQLIRAARDEHVWAQSYERDARDVLGLEDEVARAIAVEIRGRLGGPARSGAPAAPRPAAAETRAISPRAYDLYLRGLAAYRHWEKRTDREAVAFLTQALAEDSTYAPAWATLALVYLDDPGQFGTETGDVASARRMIDRALALDPTLGLAHSAKGEIELRRDWDWSGAEQEFQRAIELSPSLFEAHHMYSHLLMDTGRREASLAQARTALALDPLNPDAVLHMGWYAFFTGHPDSAIVQFEAALRLDPTFAEAYRFLSLADALAGRFGDADAAQEKGLALTGVSDTTSTAVQLRSRLAVSAVIAARRGDASRALELAARMSEGVRRGTQPAYDVAVVYALLGRKDEAFAWLDRAIAAHEEFVIALKEDPFFSSLRGDPRFGARLRRIGVPA